MKNKNLILWLRRVCCVPVWTILMFLSSCAIHLSGDFCDIYLPIYLDYENDTPETITQVNKNNIVYQSCL